jgi:purine-binding chemotaxis protein CheW
MSTNRVLSFRFNDQLFALDVNSVIDVRATPCLTEIPGAPPNLLGFSLVDGNLICIFDPRPGLNMDQPANGLPPMSVIVSTQEGPIGLVVGAVGEVIEVESESLERPPSTMSKKARILIRHICQREDELMFILNPNQLALAS